MLESFHMKKHTKPVPKTDKLTSQNAESFAALVASSYEARSKEIRSLRLHDRGEKTIHAPDLRTIVQGV